MSNTPSKHQLMGSLTSPYVRKIRILLAEKSIDYDWILDDVWGADPHVIPFNPLGQVPVLILPDGQALADSRSMVTYLEWLVPTLRKQDVAYKLAVLKWQALAEGVIDTAVKYRLEQIRPESVQWADWLTRQMDKLHRAFAVLDAHLAQHEWLANDEYSVADLTLQCGLDFIGFRIPSWVWQLEYPHLAQFSAVLHERGIYQQTYPRLT